MKNLKNFTAASLLGMSALLPLQTTFAEETKAQATAVTREVIRLTTAFTDQLRVVGTIGGTTPVFIFGVLAWADSN